jgi:hypothetical protein
MSRLIDAIWPTVEDWEPHELAEIREENVDDIAGIAQADWSRNTTLALAEARRLTDAEEDRRRTAEGKATTYLLFVGAMLPFLTYLDVAVWEGKVGAAPKWVSIPVLAIGVLYLFRAATWGFRAIRVSTFHRLDVPDLLKVWCHRDPKIELVRELLIATRRNRDDVNRKVSCVDMTQRFLKLAFLMFVILLFVEAGWEIWSTLSSNLDFSGV